jgi:hypothetical protein
MERREKLSCDHCGCAVADLPHPPIHLRLPGFFHPVHPVGLLICRGCLAFALAGTLVAAGGIATLVGFLILHHKAGM